jgi:hypothetical protein
MQSTSAVALVHHHHAFTTNSSNTLISLNIDQGSILYAATTAARPVKALKLRVLPEVQEASELPATRVGRKVSRPTKYVNSVHALW